MQQHSLDMLNNGAPSIPANIYIYIYICFVVRDYRGQKCNSNHQIC